jgi:hypothetical protein
MNELALAMELEPRTVKSDARTQNNNPPPNPTKQYIKMVRFAAFLSLIPLVFSAPRNCMDHVATRREEEEKCWRTHEKMTPWLVGTTNQCWLSLMTCRSGAD